MTGPGNDGSSGEPEEEQTGPEQTSPARPPWWRRHRRLLIGVTAGLVVLLVAGGFYVWKLNSHLGNIDRFSTDGIKNRPESADNDALNILLLGSDKGKKIPGREDTTLAEDAESGDWPTGKYRSDTLMVVHLSADRKRAYVVSIPRDSFVRLYDAGGEPAHREKINAAFSTWGPNGTIATVEHLTGLRLDHVAIIDWAGFKDLSTAVGGVPVTVPEPVYDPKQHKQWEARDYNLKGEEALKYVRMRYGLTRSDFDRIDRQQNFLRSLMSKVLEAGSLFKPVKFNDTLAAITENLTVDDGWDNGEIRGLALDLRGIDVKDVEFLTLPIKGERTHPKYGSILDVDRRQGQQLFEALHEDRMRAYLEKYPDEVLPAEEEIN